MIVHASALISISGFCASTSRAQPPCPPSFKDYFSSVFVKAYSSKCSILKRILFNLKGTPASETAVAAATCFPGALTMLLGAVDDVLLEEGWISKVGQREVWRACFATCRRLAQKTSLLRIRCALCCCANG